MTFANILLRATVGHVDDFVEGEMKLAKVGKHNVAITCTASGIHAIDNACPHQGYGLTTGTLDGDLVTCQWHNWKFRVDNGRCVMGEEDVAAHQVDIENGEVFVTVAEPTDAQRQAQLWPSLMSGISKDYVGQIARDALRLRDTGITPAEIVWEAVKYGAPRHEYGIGHEMPNAADCLQLAERADGPADQSLAIVQALAGVSEQTRGYEPWPVPEPDSAPDLVASIEAEDVKATMAKVVAEIQAGTSLDHLARDFITAVSQHHYDYGHGAIYIQKSFELLRRIDPSEAEHLLPHVAATLAWGTREDTLPYMTKAMAELETVDLSAMASGTPTGDETARDQLAETILSAEAAPIGAAARAAADGLGVVGVLDAVTLAVSKRMLRHDIELELRQDDPFGWLSITHGLTYTRAARWAWQTFPGVESARLVLFTVWLAFDTGRGERRNGVVSPIEATPCSLSVGEAISRRDAGSAVAAALHGDLKDVGRSLEQAALVDQSGAFIVQSHLVKTAVAAAEEAAAIGSAIPLAATARFMAGPRLERFVSRNAVEAARFIETGRPPQR